MYGISKRHFGLKTQNGPIQTTEGQLETKWSPVESRKRGRKFSCLVSSRTEVQVSQRES